MSRCLHQTQLDIIRYMSSANAPVLYSEMENNLTAVTSASATDIDRAFNLLLRDSLITSTFPEARPGNSGRQYWKFA